MSAQVRGTASSLGPVAAIAPDQTLDLLASLPEPLRAGEYPSSGPSRVAMRRWQS